MQHITKTVQSTSSDADLQTIQVQVQVQQLTQIATTIIFLCKSDST